MVERLLITLLLVSLGVGLFLLSRRWHLRTLNQGVGQQRTATGSAQLLYFRSDHCAPCVAQREYIQALAERFQDGVTMSEIDIDAEPERAAQYKVLTLPTTLIVDPQGEVKYINYGLTAMPKLADQLESIL